MTSNPYDDLIMDHIRNARNYRVLDESDRQASGMNPLCGDEMQVALKVDGECIADIAFQCTCCGISMASASIMTELVKGVAVGEAARLSREIVSLLNSRADEAPEMSSPERLALLDTAKRFPARTRCAVLPWVTLDAALNDEEDVVSVS